MRHRLRWPSDFAEQWGVKPYRCPFCGSSAKKHSDEDCDMAALGNDVSYAELFDDDYDDALFVD